MQNNIDLNYDKPFKTYDQQIDILKNKYKLNIPDYDFAIKALSSLSYYDLINGYQECFMEYGVYKDGITLEYLYTFLHFDRGIQNILFKYSVYVETIFKTKMAYTLSKNFGEDVNLYLNKENFARSNDTDRYKKLKKTLNNIENAHSGQYVDHPTKHYLDNKNHIPPWILFKNVKFNDIIDLYTFLLETEKDEICNSMIPSKNLEINKKKKLLKSSITIVRKFRNKIAHNLKFVTYRCDKKDELIISDLKKIISNDLITWNDLKKFNRGKNDSYAMILSLTLLLNDQYLISQMFIELLRHISDFKKNSGEIKLFEEYCRITNLPENIADRFIKYLGI